MINKEPNATAHVLPIMCGTLEAICAMLFDCRGLFYHHARFSDNHKQISHGTKTSKPNGCCSLSHFLWEHAPLSCCCQAQLLPLSVSCLMLPSHGLMLFPVLSQNHIEASLARSLFTSPPLISALQTSSEIC